MINITAIYVLFQPTTMHFDCFSKFLNIQIYADWIKRKLKAFFFFFKFSERERKKQISFSLNATLFTRSLLLCVCIFWWLYASTFRTTAPLASIALEKLFKIQHAKSIVTNIFNWLGMATTNNALYWEVTMKICRRSCWGWDERAISSALFIFIRNSLTMGFECSVCVFLCDHPAAKLLKWKHNKLSAM